MNEFTSGSWESAVVSPETAIEKIRPGMIIQINYINCPIIAITN
jgi:hypothetical protein